MDLTAMSAYLQNRRGQVTPGELGLPAGPRRRVSGLRREEVALAAGVSVDYYIAIERGTAQPSDQVVAALARALLLSPDERDHLFHLAGHPVRPDPADERVRPNMLDLLGRIRDTPAQIVTDLQVVLAQNSLADALFGPIRPIRGARASFVYRWFTDVERRALFHPDDHDDHARTLIADLRAASARRGPDDTEVTELIDALLADSEEFAALWAMHEVAVRRDHPARLVHTVVGLIELDVMELVAADERSRLVWFTAQGDAAARVRSLVVDTELVGITT